MGGENDNSGIVKCDETVCQSKYCQDNNPKKCFKCKEDARNFSYKDIEGNCNVVAYSKYEDNCGDHSMHFNSTTNTPECRRCKQGWKLKDNSKLTCVEITVGEIIVPSQSSNCDKNCSDCQNGMCNACKGKLVLSTDGSCSEKCKPGQTVTAFTKICEACPVGADECEYDKLGQQSVQKCSGTKASYMGMCIDKCPTGTLETSVGAYKYCFKCHCSCGSCAGNIFTCTTCASGESPDATTGECSSSLKPDQIVSANIDNDYSYVSIEFSTAFTLQSQDLGSEDDKTMSTPSECSFQIQALLEM